MGSGSCWQCDLDYIYKQWSCNLYLYLVVQVDSWGMPMHFVKNVNMSGVHCLLSCVVSVQSF